MDKVDLLSLWWIYCHWLGFSDQGCTVRLTSIFDSLEKATPVGLEGPEAEYKKPLQNPEVELSLTLS